MNEEKRAQIVRRARRRHGIAAVVYFATHFIYEVAIGVGIIIAIAVALRYLI